MDKESKKILSQYQCDFNRSLEENFAQVLTENDKVRLFFINEDRAFTDGENIVVDPAYNEIFADKATLKYAEDYIKIRRCFSEDPWYALRMITRGQNIHECLHILYSDFPGGIETDERATSKARKKALAVIHNIIEDAFIEAAGCSVYDNLEFYLRFLRASIAFSGKYAEKKAGGEKEMPPFIEYINYMLVFLLYPMARQGEPLPEIADYVSRTKELFLLGSACGEPKERYSFVQRIFDIIEPLIPDNLDEIVDDKLNKMLPGHKTHSGENQTINSPSSTGTTVIITRRVFTDMEGEILPEQDFNDQLDAILLSFEKEKQAALRIVLVQPVTVIWEGSDFDSQAVHKNIKIIETKPKPNLNLRRAYQNIYNKYHININSYNSRFTQLLKARITAREEKKLFGSGVTSTRLADAKKRYWYRNTDDYGVPDIAILLLLDGSGSMEGDRRESAMVSSVILHEVLKKQNIAHAIVEHRAIYDKPEVHHNILIDFMASDEEKLNILALKADEWNRDGLSLCWAERFISKRTSNEKRLIIVLSDGVPAHFIDGEGCYMPPVSVKDTANAAAKIIKRGTDIIAVALDDDIKSEFSCYEDLKQIYPSVVACTNLKQLTGQLLGIISKNLR